MTDQTLTSESETPEVGGSKGGCPVVHFDITAPRRIGAYFDELGELREQAPIVWNTYGGGFWMFLSQDTVRDAFQDYETFSSEATIPTVPEPDWHWIPTMENPPKHTAYRHVLLDVFSPRRIRQLEGEIRADAVEFIEAFKDKGSVEFVHEFAMPFPTKVFLRMIGLPEEDTDQFVQWVEDVFSGLGATDGAVDKMLAAQAGIRSYMEGVLADRKANPRDEDDFFTHLSQAEVDGKPLSDEEFLNIAGVLVLAGLDTVKSQLGYMFHYLAEHPEDRRRIIEEPKVVPTAVEEFLRAFSIVMDGRKIVKDTEFYGCPVKSGEMVMLSLPSAGRDPSEFEDADQVRIDRKINRHLAFAAGPHRCLGAHLARLELAIALEEFHRLIPDYRAVVAADQVETGPQLGLDLLRLEWEV